LYWKTVTSKPEGALKHMIVKKEIKNTLDRTFIFIELDEENKWVYNNWVGYQSFDSVVAGANACLDYLEPQKCKAILNDNRQVVGPWDHATDWIANDWTPRAIRAGLKYFAHVVDDQTLAAMSAGEMHQKVGDIFEMKVFNQIEDARDWLRSCN
jgi:hypothetical protein